MLIDITSSPYNASADGTHDDTKALKAAFETIANNGGGTVEFPKNAFVCISEALNLPSNIHITTASGKARIKYYNAANEETKYLFLGNKISNVTISNIAFDTQHQSPAVAAILINGYGKEALENSQISIENCEFKGINKKGACAVRVQKTNGITVKNCLFEDSYIGIGLWRRNSTITIHDNIFTDSMLNNAIRLTGTVDTKKPEYCDDVSIQDNHITVQAKKSVIQANGKPKGRPDSASGIYLTCGDKDYKASLHGGKSNFHCDVRIVQNRIEGPRLGFFNGGSADLFAIKDTKNFLCTKNVAIGSGDLGFAFERCHHGEVSHNTAEENNSCGIGFAGSTAIHVLHNKCGSNEQTRDGIYQNTPYGGIRIEYGSRDIFVENNVFYHLPSLPKVTQQYGVVIKYTYKNKIKHYPSNIKVGNNQSSDQVFGAVFNEADDTQFF
ncbi:right handed beta helix region [Kordia sp. SMS9]|uniref:right-handed parallel beta-helix repeat-containing protein n=1 Tax=Kordia sp. SMS9 TaxID=2282170 RepID=UPI000E0CF1DB|nr:right-handed parallel beta-helix repeat-containing protein [Kordia sp. SMS9]AXG71325.1 right handed beta helix region [Kordia sp. SMS9]